MEQVQWHFGAAGNSRQLPEIKKSAAQMKTCLIRIQGEIVYLLL